jgi:hypothetical protein
LTTNISLLKAPALMLTPPHSIAMSDSSWRSRPLSITVQGKGKEDTYLYYLVNRAQLREHCRGRSSVSTTASPVSDNGNPPIGSMPAVDGGMTTDNVECPAFHLQAPGKLVRRLGRLCYELDSFAYLHFHLQFRY